LLSLRGGFNYVATHQITLPVHSKKLGETASCYAHENDTVRESASSGAFDGTFFSPETTATEANLEILTARITEPTEPFFSSETEGDPDQPSEGMSSITDAIEAIRDGKVCPQFSLIELLFLCEA
jgi:hypothetical protein